MTDVHLFRPVDFDNLDFLDISLDNPIHLGFVVDSDVAFLFPKMASDRHRMHFTFY